MYKCPKCGEGLVDVGKKLVCAEAQCDFQCLVSAYQTIGKPWNILQCNDPQLWDRQAFDDFPTIIAREYQRIYELLEQDKRYGVLFQIKDLFEVLIKFPVLLVLAKYGEDKKRSILINRILHFLLDNRLSLGHWLTIAGDALKIKDGSSVLHILGGVVSLYNMNNIAKWRNDTIGHGALQFDDDESFRKDIESKLKIIKEHFESYHREYSALIFGFKKGKNKTRLKGAKLTGSIPTGGTLYLYYGDKIIDLSTYIKVHDRGIYFFDTYLRWDRKTKMLNYINAKIYTEKNPYFEQLFKSICKDLQVGKQEQASSLDDGIYLASEEKLLTVIDAPEQVTVPSHLENWIDHALNNHDKGIFLIQMEGGMGKTTFARLLDPHSGQRKIKRSGLSVRAYYINDAFSYKIDTFKHNLIDILQHDDSKDDYIKGEIPQFDAASNTKGKMLSSILSFFRQAYASKFGNNKLLLILDGLDEIPAVQEESIFDYIPNEEMLDQGIYLLLTCRTSKENSDFVNDNLALIQTRDRIEISANSESYQQMISAYLEKYSLLASQDERDKVIELADGKFLKIKLLQQVIRHRGFCSLQEGMNSYKVFLEIVNDLYSDKYFGEVLRILIVLASSRSSLTIREIGYLLNRDGADFRLLAYIADLGVLLRKERTYRGNTITVVHGDLRKYVLACYKEDVQKTIECWLQDAQDDIVSTDLGEEGRMYLTLNSIYFVRQYHKASLPKIINSSSHVIRRLAEMYSAKSIKVHQVQGVLQYFNDYIEVLEEFMQDSNVKVDIPALISAYLLKTQMFIDQGFGSSAEYGSCMDKAVQLIEDNKYTIHSDVKMQVYTLRSFLYRITGNVRKSMEDMKRLVRCIAQGDVSLDEYMDRMDHYDLDAVSKAQLCLQYAIHLKNLGDIESALYYSKNVLDLLEGAEHQTGRLLQSDAYNTLGLCLLKVNQLEEAKVAMEKSLRITEILYQSGFERKKVAYYENLGQILRRMQEFQGAEQAYTTAIERLKALQQKGYAIDNNRLSNGYNGRANVYRDLGIQDEEKEYFDKALADYSRALELVENLDDRNQNVCSLANLYGNLATLYQNLLYDQEKAKDYFAKYDQQRRQLLKMQLDDTTGLESDEEIDVAADWIEPVRNQNIAEGYVKRGKFKEAGEFYQKAINTLKYCDENSLGALLLPFLHYNMAECQYALLEEQVMDNFARQVKSGKAIVADYSQFHPQDIIETYEQALKLDKDNLLSKDERTQIYGRMSEIFCEVIKDYDRAITISQKIIDEEIEPSIGYCGLGNVYCELKEYQKAIDSFSQAVRLNDNHINAYKNRAFAWEQLGRRDKAQEDMRQVARIRQSANSAKSVLESNRKMSKESGSISSGRLYYPDGTVQYQGGVQNGQPSGYGVSFYKTGKMQYQGEFENGKHQGFGMVYSQEDGSLKYVGELVKNQPHGKGKAYFAGELGYEGEFFNGAITGKGKLYYSGGELQYEGYIVPGMLFEGPGKYYFPSGTIKYDCQWKQGEPVGMVTEYYITGEIAYQGEYRECLRNGQGISYYKNGTEEYCGCWKGGHAEQSFALKGIEAYKRKAYQEAILWLSKEISQNPFYHLTYYGRGCAYGEAGNYTSAIEDFDKCIEMDRDYEGAYIARAIALGKDNQILAARTYLKEIMEKYPSKAVIQQQGRELLQYF